MRVTGGKTDPLAGLSSTSDRSKSTLVGAISGERFLARALKFHSAAWNRSRTDQSTTQPCAPAMTGRSTSPAPFGALEIPVVVPAGFTAVAGTRPSRPMERSMKQDAHAEDA